MPTPNKIPLPENLPDTTLLRLQDGLDPNKNTFITQVKGDKTKTAAPVEALLVDHALVESDRGGTAFRCLFVVTKGKDLAGNDVAGHNVVADLAMTPDSRDFTAATMRLMGLDCAALDAATDALAKKPDDAGLRAAAEKATMAFLALLGDSSKSGAQTKRLQIKVAEEEFNGAVQKRVPLGGILQFASTMTAEAAKLKLGDVMGLMAASKAGPPRRDFGGGSGGGAAGGQRQPRPPRSAPPTVDKGKQEDDDFSW